MRWKYRAAERARLADVPDQLAETRRALLGAAFLGALTEEWRRVNKVSDDGRSIVESYRKEHQEFWDAERLNRSRKRGVSSRAFKSEVGYQPAEKPDIPGDVKLPKSWSKAATEELTRPGRPILYGIIKPPSRSSGYPVR
jgi:type I restriction enzyme S subunit